MHKLIPLIVCAGIAACSSQPHQDSPVAPAAATQRSAPAGEPAEAAATLAAQEAAPAIAPVAKESEEKFRVPAGYKAKSKGGETVYCRSQTPVGTRFPTEYCFTQAQLERMEKSKQTMQEDHSMRTRMCTTGAACGGT